MSDTFFQEKTREQVLEWLRVKYDKGFRYVVRDCVNDTWLVIYSMKPKRYMDDGCWGYRERDFDNIESMPAEIIRNSDMHESSWNNRSPTDLEKLLKIGVK